MQDAYLRTAGNLAGECFAPSQAVLKPLEQPELQVDEDSHQQIGHTGRMQNM
jgi:hypothetical protein